EIITIQITKKILRILFVIIMRINFISNHIFGYFCFDFEFGFEFIDVCDLHVYFLCSHKNMFEPRRAHELTTYKISLVCYTYIELST
ncbi:hypothetical protein BUY87_13360, partial [Staphylococcus equorum]